MAKPIMELTQILYKFAKFEERKYFPNVSLSISLKFRNITVKALYNR